MLHDPGRRFNVDNSEINALSMQLRINKLISELKPWLKSMKLLLIWRCSVSSRKTNLGFFFPFLDSITMYNHINKCMCVCVCRLWDKEEKL